MQVATTREYAFSGFTLTPALMRLEQGGQQVVLPHGAFNTLLFLVENRSRTVTKAELMEHVWPGTAVEENNLNQCVSALRKAFGDTRREARFIATIPGVGYRFVMEVTEREPATPTVAAAPDSPLRQNRRFVQGAVLLVSLILIGVIAYKILSPNKGTAILVLPLRAFGASGGESEYIRKGIATEIEAALARNPDLHVVAGIPDSVLNQGDVSEIARKVNARAVLRGQVSESGDLLAFTFELVNPETNRILWSDQFGMKRQELGAAESRVVAAVFKTIEPGRAPPALHIVNPAAHELVMRAKFIALTRKPGDLDQAISLFERAVRLDSEYTDAWVGMADASALRAVNGDAPGGVLSRARTAALRAIALDPGSAPAHAALGLVEYGDWNWAAARSELQKALALNPWYSLTHHRLAMVHYIYNNYAEAERELKVAQEINPYVGAHAFTLAEVYLGARRYDEVIRVGELLRQVTPANAYPHLLEMYSYQAMGNGSAAFREIQTAAQLDGAKDLLAWLAIAEGRLEDARRLAAERDGDEPIWAQIYARLGDREQMLGILDRLISRRSVIVVEMKDDPNYDAYRSDPLFQALVRRLNLPAR